MEWLKSIIEGESGISLLVIGGTIGAVVGALLERLRNPGLHKLKAENARLKTVLVGIQSKFDGARKDLERQRQQLVRLNMLRKALKGDEDELWKLFGTGAPPEVANRLAVGQPKIITVLNLKGGVGKTTTVANLAAHFGTLGRRVLVIDLDYQGSLSRMLALAANERLDASDATDFLSGKQDPAALKRQVTSLNAALPNVDLVHCNIKFDRFENREMLSWFIGDRKDDIRYRLAKVLTDDAFRKYELVLIDAPPRLSLGAINALATSHAVLIPTVLDGLSAEAISTLITRLNTLRSMNNSLHFAGVIGTLRGQQGGADVADRARQTAKVGLAKWQGRTYLCETDIRYYTDLAREAGSNVGYLKHKDVRDAYSRLAGEIERELRL